MTREDLIERLQGPASNLTRDLDVALALAFGGPQRFFAAHGLDIDGPYVDGPACFSDGATWGGGGHGWTAPFYTGSIDAALSLRTPRQLAWSWRLGNLPSGRFFCTLGTSLTEHIAASPARAICLALVRTLPA